MNSLNQEVMQEVSQILNEVESNPQIQSCVLISSKPNCFIAGADINMLASCKSEQEVINISK